MYIDPQSRRQEVEKVLVEGIEAEEVLVDGRRL
jgi:hypothetical protein